MKEEYDFTDAEQGKFFKPLEELDIPIYLDKEIKKYFYKKLKDKKSPLSMNELINTLLKKDIEIFEKLES